MGTEVWFDYPLPGKQAGALPPPHSSAFGNCPTQHGEEGCWTEGHRPTEGWVKMLQTKCMLDELGNSCPALPCPYYMDSQSYFLPVMRLRSLLCASEIFQLNGLVRSAGCDTANYS